MKKTIKIASLVIMAASLSACHENPLKVQSKNKSAAFLIGASATAERELKLGIPEGSLGGVYTDCMESRTEKVNCKSLYEAMIAFAHTGKYPDFKNLTLADLQDREVFESLRDEYEEVLLTTELKD